MEKIRNKVLAAMEASSIKRLNVVTYAITFISIVLVFTSDLFNYFNNIWDEYPSQYYVFLNHILSVPILLLLIMLNKYYLSGKIKHKWVTFNSVLVFNFLCFTPFLYIYLYWELLDYSSNGIFIIYIFTVGMAVRVNNKDNIILCLFFVVSFFGVAYFSGIRYSDNPSIFLNGVASIAIFYFLSKASYKVAYSNTRNELLVVKNKEELELLHSELQDANHLVRKQNIELELSNDNLLNFANIAAHDLKAPLRTISSASEILSRKYRDKLEENDKQLQDFVVNAGNDLSKMIDGLLEFSKVSSDSNLEFSKVDLDSLIAESISMLNSKIVK